MTRIQKENDTKKAEENKKLLQQNSSETPLNPFTRECHRKPQLGATNAFFSGRYLSKSQQKNLL